MEENYFLDRPDERKFLKEIYPGRQVFICTKNMQKYATNIKHLDLVVVKKNLTKEPEHPRGQKIIGERESDGVELIGRVIYVLNKDGLVITKEGLKDLYLDPVTGKFRVYLIFNIFDKLNVRILLEKYRFFNTREEAELYAKNIKEKITHYVIGNGYVKVTIDGKENIYKGLEYMVGDNVNHNITDLKVYDQLYFSGTVDKSSKFTFGKEYVIKPKKFHIKKIKGEFDFDD